MPKATRLGDNDTGHDACAPTALVTGSTDVIINGKGAGRVGDSYAPHGCVAHPTHSGVIASGSSSVYINGNKLTGTMRNNGAVTGTISTKDESYTIPIGYHDGSGKVAISTTEQAKLIATNIRSGVKILGVTGTMSGTEGAKAQAKTATPSTTQQTILPDSTGGYNYLSQVTVEAIPYTESDNAAGGTTVTIA